MVRCRFESLRSEKERRWLVDRQHVQLLQVVTSVVVVGLSKVQMHYRRQRFVGSWVRGAFGSPKRIDNFFIGGDMIVARCGTAGGTCVPYTAVRRSGLTWTWPFASGAVG
jgi:hypothetical protein